ncbi:hypothetical protein C5167_036285 [Papaver somniferum]|nr:hypothetical protein C5167_036285 [Papaver somniferum]
MTRLEDHITVITDWSFWHFLLVDTFLPPWHSLIYASLYASANVSESAAKTATGEDAERHQIHANGGGLDRGDAENKISGVRGRLASCRVHRI